jgi:hypothetical protein
MQNAKCADDPILHSFHFAFCILFIPVEPFVRIARAPSRLAWRFAPAARLRQATFYG